MTTMQETIVPKSDQMNSDDLIGKTITIKVTSVAIAMGEQPVSIHYEGDNGKPYKPGKSMRRVLVQCWGDDANKYIGRSMTLYRDEKVRFGGVDVGGIRISHLSHMDAAKTMALTASKAVRKPFTVVPLVVQEAKPSLDDALSDIGNAPDMGTLMETYKHAYKAFKDIPDREKLEASYKAKKAVFSNANPDTGEIIAAAAEANQPKE